MIDPRRFLADARTAGITQFAGVPDSLLKDVCACFDAELDGASHLITANEGNAVALAVGHYIATGGCSLVYLQNSGLGNIVNPLTSLADVEVYSVPMVLLIGWRGEPGIKDEPQHIKQGRVTPQLLDALEIPYYVVDSDTPAEALISYMSRASIERRPIALLVRKNAFASYPARRRADNARITREAAIGLIARLAAPDDLFVATTGHVSRELYEYHQRVGRGDRDFLTVGGMGHTSSIALGVALGQPERRVLCLDGDGSLLMHMGMMPIIGAANPSNLVHIVLNNGAHDSVGGQPTVAEKVDFPALAVACGYKRAVIVWDLDALEAALASVDRTGTTLIEVRVRRGARADLGRPTTTPRDNLTRLMASIGTL